MGCFVLCLSAFISRCPKRQVPDIRVVLPDIQEEHESLSCASASWEGCSNWWFTCFLGVFFFVPFPLHGQKGRTYFGIFLLLPGLLIRACRIM